MRAVIVTSQRTGSTFLTQCLDSHPQVRCYAEILAGTLYSRNHVPRVLDRVRKTRQAWRYFVSGAWNPTKLLEDFYSRDEAPVMAFKAMYNHLRDPRTRRHLSKDSDIRVIHLRRDNLLKQYVSRVLAQERFGQQPWSTTDVMPTRTATISPSRAMTEMRRMLELYYKHQLLFAQHPMMELVYETMIDGQSLSGEATAAVVDFLDLDPGPMRAKTMKVTPDSLSLIIENYDEVDDALRGTEFERFLD